MPDGLTFWYLIAGGVLIAMALAGSVIRRLPLSTSTLYLLIGLVLGPMVLGRIRLDPIDDAALIHRLAEVAVIVSLFTAGLKIRMKWRDRRWRTVVRLASVSMIITVVLVACAGVWGLGLTWGAAILLGAILAPTDPVLASDVQLEDAFDRDEVRFSLTGEAGLNDGTAFPMVMLGLGLLGLHPLGAGLWRWWTVDVLWAVTCGLVIGAAAGCAVGKLVLYLREKHQEALGRDEFLAMGLIALSYGLAIWAKGYGFLAVFAAGLALRQMEMSQSREGGAEADPERLAREVQPAPPTSAAQVTDPQDAATDPQKAPAYLAGAVLFFNEQLERFLEVALVLLVGGLLSWKYLTWELAWFVPLLFLVIRQAAVWAGLWGGRPEGGGRVMRRGLISWFGIRGVGSIYYLMFSIEHGLDRRVAAALASVTLGVIAVSIVVHGISVTPLMGLYQRKRRANAAPDSPSPPAGGPYTRREEPVPATDRTLA